MTDPFANNPPTWEAGDLAEPMTGVDRAKTWQEAWSLIEKAGNAVPAPSDVLALAQWLADTPVASVMPPEAGDGLLDALGPLMLPDQDYEQARQNASGVVMFLFLVNNQPIWMTHTEMMQSEVRPTPLFVPRRK